MTISWVHAFIDVPAAQIADTQRFWSSATGGVVTSPWEGHPEFVSLQPPTGAAYVHVQRIDGDPRVHIDLATDQVDDEAARLVELGAERVERFRWWQVMTSPGGLPFCLCEDPSRARPDPITWPDGHRSRVAQVCLDIPAASYDTEVLFWINATGWTTEGSNRAEFESLVPPPSSPVKLLLQRLGEDDTRSETSAHIDLGTDDRSAEIDRLVGLAAIDVEQPPNPGGWHVLEDPAGLRFCVTGRPPD
jgi:hypothetical protein